MRILSPGELLIVRLPGIMYHLQLLSLSDELSSGSNQSLITAEEKCHTNQSTVRTARYSAP